MRAFASHLRYEFLGGLRDKGRLFMGYLFPLAFFALVGSLMSRLDPSFADRAVPAMVVFAAMSSYLLSLPAGLVAARDSGLLRSYRVNGVPPAAAIAAPVLSDAAHLALVSAIIGGASALALGSPAPAEPAAWLAAWAATTAAIAGLGALVGVVAASSRSANLLAQCVYLPSILLGGLMMSPNVLPPALARLALLFPATHAMRAFAAAGSGAPTAWVSLAALAAGAAAAFGLASLLYEWDGRNAGKPGRKLLGLLALVPYAATLLVY